MIIATALVGAVIALVCNLVGMSGKQRVVAYGCVLVSVWLGVAVGRGVLQ